ncbi:hypothetical protein C482_01946 [Natrialba chahannaoensis JCM 10990]|uniref:Uncharacterized protein n=1 Tax=Natrialba chahannaoensis JCM 10990 TaxID=1227492 RepID=M0B495_9EURY|nr:hypothetical protein [Natrialba chahannaoensis]ELZ05635.1 hypothetical protein C482_01946 [Natrialba chahannaoensis JCM 10990]
MLEWIGGPTGLVDLALPLVGVLLVVAGKVYATPHRSWRYFAWGFGFWFTFTLVLRLEEGTLVSIPSAVGLTVSGLLWLCLL